MNILEDIANVCEIDADDAIKFSNANGWAVDGFRWCQRNPHVLICCLLITMSPSASCCPSRLPA
jgi:hypothetical protein